MAKKRRKARATCLGCGHLLGASDRFCGNCSRPNPNRAVKSQRPAVVKSAGSGMAAVYSFGPVRDSRWGRDFYEEDNPERREELLSLITKDLKGGAA